MKTFSLNIHLQETPPVAKRKNHALIVLKNQQGHYIFATKKHYPAGISRLVGGGMEDGEEPELAALRELQEEMGFTPNPQQMQELALITAHMTDKHNQEYDFNSYLYLYQLTTETLEPQDDVDGVVELTQTEWQQLVQKQLNLPTDPHPILKFSWNDWGQLYGRIHQIALELIRTVPVQ